MTVTADLAETNGSLTWAEIRTRKKPRTTRVTIVLDDEAERRHNEAQIGLAAAQRALEERPRDEARTRAVADAEAAADRARGDLEAASATFVFRGIGHVRYDELLKASPPSKADAAEFRRLTGSTLRHDPVEFPIALVAACCIEPEMTVDDVWALWE